MLRFGFLPSTAWEKKKRTEILIHARSTIKCQGLWRFKCTLNAEMVFIWLSLDLSKSEIKVYFEFEIIIRKFGQFKVRVLSKIRVPRLFTEFIFFVKKLKNECTI